MAHFLNANLPGVYVPEPLIKELEESTDPGKKGLEIAARTIRDLKGIAHGVHIMAMGMEEKIPEILEMVK
jgi:5,10-methylenetetrahydrofolate reductase